MPLRADDLRRFLHEELGLPPDPAGDRLGDQAPLFSSGRLDSHSMIELLAYLEAQVGRRPSWSDVHLENMDSVEKIMRYGAVLAARG